jgi:hypothetical protein
MSLCSDAIPVVKAPRARRRGSYPPVGLATPTNQALHPRFAQRKTSIHAHNSRPPPRRRVTRSARKGATAPRLAENVAAGRATFLLVARGFAGPRGQVRPANMRVVVGEASKQMLFLFP